MSIWMNQNSSTCKMLIPGNLGVLADLCVLETGAWIAWRLSRVCAVLAVHWFCWFGAAATWWEPRTDADFSVALMRIWLEMVVTTSQKSPKFLKFLLNIWAKNTVYLFQIILFTTTSPKLWSNCSKSTGFSKVCSQ